MDREALSAFYPYLIVRNKLDRPVQVLYINDTCQVQPGRQVKISSEGLLQIPNSNEIELVNPTLMMLVEAGILPARNAE